MTPADVLGDGDVDELLSVGQVARLLRVTPQYVRRLCDAHLRRRRRRATAPGDAALSTGPATVRWRRIGSGGATSPSSPHARRPPVARVGFDADA